MEAIPRELRIYITKDNKSPFKNWLESLKDLKTVAKIEIRLDQLEKGNFGDCRGLKEGIFELRIDYDPGYRIYCGQIGNQIVLLLSGGDKSTQEKDILKAEEYWLDYRKRENGNK